MHKNINKLMTPFRYNKVEGEDASKMIINVINSPRPALICRFGSFEIQTLAYLKHPYLLSLMKERTLTGIKNNAGVFPLDAKTLEYFYNEYMQAIKEIDILASWRFEERIFFSKELNNKKKISLCTLDSYNNSLPWTSALKDKKVLVVSPFADSIFFQYTNNREKLFKNEQVLPLFKAFHAYKSVQSIGGKCVDFISWIDALNYMTEKIANIDFDVAILGCGAYGMPLAARIKKMGKKAVHVGGATQMLFGVKGKRWKGSPYINDYFITPSNSDTPVNFRDVEGGCYW